MPFITARGYLLLLPYLGYLLWKTSPGRSGSDPAAISRAHLLWAVVIALFAFLVSDWLGGEIKKIIMRPRPFLVFDDARVLVGKGGSFSMPSNHAINSFAAAVSLFYFTWRKIPPAWAIYPLVLAGLIAFSRVYVGVHYPSDVVAGALFGTSLSLVLIAFFSFCRNRYRTKPYTTALFGGLVALSIFRIYYILHGPLDLSPDEAHYWEWSRRLDLSYYSKGPMIAYLIYLGTALFGDTVFGIRIMAVIFSALSSVYLYKLVALMYHEKDDSTVGPGSVGQQRSGRDLGAMAALLFQGVPLFAPFGVIFSIDAPFLFFWILSLYLFYKAVAAPGEGRWRDWLAVGVAAGLGLLTKYTMAFFLLSAFLLLLLSDKRSLLKSPKPYGALIVSLLVFSPVLLWNVQHGWVTMKHTAGQAHIAKGLALSFKSFSEFLGSQIGVVTPALFGMMLYALFRLKYTINDLRSKVLFYFSIPIISFFLLKSLQGKVQANWAMTGYITGVVAFIVYFFRSRVRQCPRARYLSLFAVGFALLLTAVSHYPSLLKLPPKMDPSSRLRGWEELGREVGSIEEALGREGEVLIFSDSYQVASELAFYVKGQPKTYAINLGRRMNQYDLWPGINSAAAAARQGNPGGTLQSLDAIFVKIGSGDVPPEVAAACERTERRLFRVYERETLLREYSLFICYNFGALATKQPERY